MRARAARWMRSPGGARCGRGGELPGPAFRVIMFVVIGSCPSSPAGWPGGAHTSQGGRMALWQVLTGGERRLARGPAGRGPAATAGQPPHHRRAARRRCRMRSLPPCAGPRQGRCPRTAAVVAPLGGQEVWAAGVTYTRSRDARVLESGTPDPYQRVYQAERPELFLKATPGRVRGPGEPVGIRADSGWDVPEPELAVVADPRGHIVGYLNGNDMSSRSIEGENPLYLPQAKVYTGSCAIGPCLVTPDEVPGLSVAADQPAGSPGRSRGGQRHGQCGRPAPSARRPGALAVPRARLPGRRGAAHRDGDRPATPASPCARVTR